MSDWDVAERLKAARHSGVATDAPPAPPEYSKESLRKMANEALATLLARVLASPDDYKPNEIIAACREALDRTDGKPTTTHELSGNAVINIIGQVPAPASMLPVIDIDK